MSSLRQIKKRIKSVENTRKIARAMELVSNTKLRRIGERVNAMRPYVDHLDKILRNVAMAITDMRHPLVEERKKKNNIVVCVVTSDSGLCGSYNMNILRAVDEFVKKWTATPVTIVPIGKKGFTYYKNRRYQLGRSFIGLNGKYHEESIDQITAHLHDLFIGSQTDEVYLGYTRFESTTRHRPVIEKFLNVKPQVDGVEKTDFLWEPNQARIFDEAIKEYLVLKVRSVMLQAFACEHSARVIAMSMAKENAMELLENLILTQNKIRQALITKDILEIVSAAEALKG